MNFFNISKLIRTKGRAFFVVIALCAAAFVPPAAFGQDLFEERSDSPDRAVSVTIPLSLDMACRTALVNNENIQIAKETVSQAENDVGVANSYLYPQINAIGSHVRQKELSPLVTPVDEYDLYQLTVDQHVYQMGKVWTGRRMAKIYMEGTQLSYERTVREILFQVCAAYYNVLLGRQSIEIAQSALSRANKQLERAQALFEVGSTTATTVLRAEVQVAQALEQLERANNQYLVAREMLALEMGIEAFSEDVVEPAPGVFPEQSLDGLIARALESRKDLQVAQLDMRNAEEQVRWKRADFFPNISLHGEFQRTSDEALFYDDEDNWSASLNLSCPLFTGGRNRAELNSAKSALRQARAAVDRFEKSVRAEVRSVYLDLQTQRKVLQQNRLQVASAEKNYEQVTAQFEEGMATSVDQVDAFTALNQAQNLLANAHYTYQLNLIKLKLATGTFHADSIGGSF